MTNCIQAFLYPRPLLQLFAIVFKRLSHRTHSQATNSTAVLIQHTSQKGKHMSITQTDDFVYQQKTQSFSVQRMRQNGQNYTIIEVRSIFYDVGRFIQYDILRVLKKFAKYKSFLQNTLRLQINWLTNYLNYAYRSDNDSHYLVFNFFSPKLRIEAHNFLILQGYSASYHNEGLEKQLQQVLDIAKTIF